MKPVIHLCVVVAFLCWGNAAFASLIQWDTGSGGNGHFYEVVPAGGPISWSAAEANAVAAGGHLATITSAAEQSFVFGLAQAVPSAFEPTGFQHGPWLGGFQAPGSVEPGQGWQWATGEPFSYQLWDGGEPNNSGGVEDFLHIHGLNAAVPGGWNDIAESGQSLVHGYIVEIVPEPSAGCLILGGMLLLTVRRRRADRRQKSE